MKHRKRIIAVSLLLAMLITTISSSFGNDTEASAAKKKKVTLKLSKTSVKLQQGKKATLKLKRKNVKKVKSIKWSVKNKKIAKVTKKGIVSAVKAGTTTLTCKVKYVAKGTKKTKKKTLKCKITVIKKAASHATKKPVVTWAPTPTQGADETPAPTPTQGADETPAPTPTQGTVETPTPTGKTAFDIVDDMGIGINLGNTMEACGSWINSSNVSNYETAWGAPITTQEMITGMKQAGFDSIRIPVAWSNMMSADGQYTIKSDYFDRVETIMNYAFHEEMYVIINIHYDSGWWAEFGSTDAEERAEAMTKYRSMWTQIANRYRDYSDKLIFESANEELGSRLNSVGDYEKSGYFSDEDSLYELTNIINQSFVNIVRGTGGNNSTRYLLIAGYNTDIAKTCDERYQMPTDTIGDHMMISVHYYSPSTYCIADSVDNSWGYMDSWGTEKDIAAMKSDLAKMKSRFVDQGIPVIIGEYGVADTKLSDNSYQRKEGREIYFKTICEYALMNGMVPVLWDTGSVYDRLSARIKDVTEADVFLEMNRLASAGE